MSTHLLPTRKRATALAAALCAALALTACGDNDSKSGSEAPPGGSAPPAAASDSFFAYVMARVNSLLETDEPADIEAVVETKPEDTEPAPLGS